MASGDITLTDYGTTTFSGAKAIVDTINMTTISGQLFILPTANGQQVQIFKTEWE